MVRHNSFVDKSIDNDDDDDDYADGSNKEFQMMDDTTGLIND